MSQENLVIHMESTGKIFHGDQMHARVVANGDAIELTQLVGGCIEIHPDLFNIFFAACMSSLSRRGVNVMPILTALETQTKE